MVLLGDVVLINAQRINPYLLVVLLLSIIGHEHAIRVQKLIQVFTNCTLVSVDFDFVLGMGRLPCIGQASVLGAANIRMSHRASNFASYRTRKNL